MSALSRIKNYLISARIKLSLLFGAALFITTIMSPFSNLVGKANTFKIGDLATRTIRSAEEVVFAEDEYVINIKKGQVLIRAGDIVSPIQEKQLKHVEVKSQQNVYSLIGLFFLTTLSLISPYLVLKRLKPNLGRSERDLSAITVTLLGTFSVIALFDVLGKTLSLSNEFFETGTFVLTGPVASGGLIIQSLIGGVYAVLYTLTLSIVGSVFLRDNPHELLVLIFGNLGAAYFVSNNSSRSAFLKAGCWVGLLNGLVSAGYIFTDAEATPLGLLQELFFPIFGGIVSGILAGGLVPLYEYIWGYITETKLLELASLDRPLLRDLSLQAPGTWNHSVNVSQLAEAAANSIRGNALLVRVGAYYHDIGKLKKPAYFIENQFQAGNKHDKLVCSMSALIIKSHVKDGVELAEEQRLPEGIINLIKQHHGSSLIEYFYAKALKDAEKTGEEVDESHYRYPGPKPQSKEAAILMIADSVEACSRTVLEPTPAKINTLVKQTINKIFVSGELDESTMTLKDLHSISKAFQRVLNSSLHKRVSYVDKSVSVEEDFDHGLEGFIGSKAILGGKTTRLH